MNPYEDDADGDDPGSGRDYIPTGRRKTFVYRREVLYEEVWAEPVRVVAKRYGVSDVALAKMCRKLKVPLPGRGYWARKKAGKPPKRPGMRPLAKGEPAEVKDERWVPLSEVELKQIEEAREKARAERKRTRQLAEDESSRIRLARARLEEWRLARDLRDFVAEGQSLVIDGGAKITKGGPLEEEFEWILDYADRVDPFRVLRQKVAEIARKKRETNDAPPKTGAPPKEP